jgi:hypothetical protein
VTLRDLLVITKRRKDAPEKIDLAVAAVVAFERAHDRPVIEPTVSIYETRGVLTLGAW